MLPLNPPPPLQGERAVAGLLDGLAFCEFLAAFGHLVGDLPVLTLSQLHQVRGEGVWVLPPGSIGLCLEHAFCRLLFRMHPLWRYDKK